MCLPREWRARIDQRGRRREERGATKVRVGIERRWCARESGGGSSTGRGGAGRADRAGAPAVEHAEEVAFAEFEVARVARAEVEQRHEQARTHAHAAHVRLLRAQARSVRVARRHCWRCGSCLCTAHSPHTMQCSAVHLSMFTSCTRQA